jgi:lysophospholipase L1-like esterase
MKKKILFYTIMIMIPVVFGIVALKLTMKYMEGRIQQSRMSDYEKELVKSGYTKMSDLRARVPYVMFRPKPVNSEKSTAINSLGFNSPEIAKEKKPGEFRVAMVGGSAVFNGSHQDSIMSFLAKEIKAQVPSLKNREVTFINAGIPSAVSSQELAQLIYHLLPLRIDLLVVFNGFNDFFIPFNFDRRPGYPYDYIVEEYRYYKFISNRTWWTNFVSLFDYGFWKKSQKEIIIDYYKELGIEVPSQDVAERETMNIYFRNIEYMATIANAFGIRTAVFMQPYSPRHNKPGGVSNADILLKLYAEASEKYKSLSMKNSQTRLFHDMVYMGFRMEDKFTDIVHFNSEANHIVAREMLQVMKKNRMLD